MSTANQQTFAEAGFERRATLLEKERRRKVQDLKYPSKKIDELVKDLSVEDKERYYADIKVMSYIHQGIPNDIYNSADACQDAKAMWNHVGRLMQGTNLSEKERHSWLMNEFDKFSAEAGKSLTSVHERNQAVIQYIRVDIQRKNVGYAGNGSRNTRRITGNQGTNAGNGFAQKNVHLDVEENDFMLMSAYGEDQLEELNISVIMMARIQPIDNNSDAKPTYDVGVISEVNASQINLIKHITVDDQLDSDIIFDDPYVEVNSGQVEHDQDAPDQKFVGFKSLINNVQIEVKNQCRLNNELKTKHALM
ncbi:hypothetical protein Tco_1421518 [Tanacetum coccineum]